MADRLQSAVSTQVMMMRGVMMVPIQSAPPPKANGIETVRFGTMGHLRTSAPQAYCCV